MNERCKVESRAFNRSTATSQNHLSRVERNSFLAEPHLTRMSTIRSDGWAHTTPVYYTWEDGVFWHSIGPNRQHQKNLSTNSKITECIDIDLRMEQGISGGAISVVCFGEASIIDEPGRVRAITGSMLKRYMGEEQGQVYLDLVSEEFGNGRVAVKVTPARWITWDFRKAPS